MLNRRDILNLGVATASVSTFGAASSPAQAKESAPATLPIIDTNISLFRWPFRRLPLDDVTDLTDKLTTLEIGQAWAGSFEGILQRDVASTNRRLAQTCRDHVGLTAIGTVNPALPDWEEDLRRCVHSYHMPGIRLHPNYHDYTLVDPRFRQLLNQATAAGRFVQIAVAMEDTRTQHPQVRVPDVDIAPLADLMPAIPAARIQILNCRPSRRLLKTLATTPRLFFDTSRVEGTDGVPELVAQLPPGRVLFGTHAPFLVPESALIRVHESDRLDGPALRDVLSGNAMRMVGHA